MISTAEPDREPDLAIRFWTDGPHSHLCLDAGPDDKAMVARVLRQIADMLERPTSFGGQVSPN